MRRLKPCPDCGLVGAHLPSCPTLAPRKRDTRAVRCVCGYLAEGREDLEEHILEAAHADDCDHAEAR